MFTLVVVLVDIRVLFNDLLFEGSIIYRPGFVQRSVLQRTSDVVEL